MVQSVQIEGMTCQNCRSSVETKLSAIKNVSKVAVSLENATASFETPQPLSIVSIEKILGEKYSVRSIDEPNLKSATPTKWRQLRPLFFILGYVFAGSLLLSYGQGLANFMQFFMGLFYIVFSFFKFLDYKGFPSSFQQYDPIAKKWPFYGWIYPFLETALGLAFLLSLQLEIALWVTLFILGSTTFGVIQQLRKKNTIQCACLGTVLNLPMTEATLVENTIMLLMALSMLYG